MREYYAQPRRDVRARVSQARAAGRSARDGSLAGRTVRRPPRARSRLRHRLVDAARRTRRRELAGHRPEPRDDGRRAGQAACPCSVRFADGRCLHAGPASSAAALRRRLRRLLVEPRAAGAAAAMAGAAACTPRAGRAGGDARQPLRCRPAAPPISRRDADGNTYQQPHARRRQRARGAEELSRSRDECHCAAIGPRALRRVSGSNTSTTGS